MTDAPPHVSWIVDNHACPPSCSKCAAAAVRASSPKGVPDGAVHAGS